MESLFVGIVGAGFAANFHAEAWKKGVRGVDVILCGVSALEGGEAFAKKHDIDFYSSLDEMMGDVDLVDCCVPDYAHEGVVVRAAGSGRDVICEKLLTGYFGTEKDRKTGRKIGFEVDRQFMLEEAMRSCDRIERAIDDSGVNLLYAENWVYAPAVEKITKTLAQDEKTKILFMDGEESHRGSHSKAYGIWTLHGSGSTSGKLCHPIGAMLRLKYEEGMRLRGKPFRPKEVSALVTHNWRDIAGYKELVGKNIRTDYDDVEDGVYATIIFDDNTTACVRSNEYHVGGVLNPLRIDASNQSHRISLAPNPSVLSYAASADVFGDEYLTEKVDCRGGHNFPAPNELYDLGYEAEFEAFARSSVINGEELPVDSLMLARDTVAICYGALLSAERKGQLVNLEPYLGS